jgi:hypothetical protein
MKTQPITEYSKEALKEISKHLEFSHYQNNQVIQNKTYENFVDIVDDLATILDAIETIGYQGSNRDLAICGGLAGIAKKMIPRNEMDFLDSLLIKKEDSKTTFSKIENL